MQHRAEPDVTICIPAWQAEPFIDRTLTCARTQTHDALRILISIDRCDDATEAICRAHEGDDPRVQVIAQSDRLGWSENANFLLGQVETEFFFLYFHDDIIEPTYTEELRQALLEHPHAQSAHCDLQHFGLDDRVLPGASYRGSADRRMVRFLTAPVKGTPLRSLTRSELLGRGLRFPAIGDNGFWRCYPFVLQLFGEGEAVRVPQILYRRWMREGSMTTTWQPTEMAKLVEGQRESARRCLELVDRFGAPRHAELTRFCVYLFHMKHVRMREPRISHAPPIDAAMIAPEFAAYTGMDPAALLRQQDAEVRDWVLTAHAELQDLERAAA